jgi:hypothetical protein
MRRGKPEPKTYGLRCWRTMDAVRIVGRLPQRDELQLDVVRVAEDHDGVGALVIDR